MDCIFCKIASGEKSCLRVYEDELVVAFMDIDPINEGHVLLIPKVHYLDVDEMPDMFVPPLQNPDVYMPYSSSFHST